MSTTTAVTAVLDEVKTALSERKKVMIVALDASAAFDLIPRSFLLESVKIIGTGHFFQSWLGSYLSKRQCLA